MNERRRLLQRIIASLNSHSYRPNTAGRPVAKTPLNGYFIPLEKTVNTRYTYLYEKAELLSRAQLFYEENELLELEHAIDVASKAHKGQKRKSGEPYIIHPLAVSATLIDWGMDIDTVLAGILHDTVEDTDTTLEALETTFGKDVAFLVDGVTKVSQARAGMQDLTEYLLKLKITSQNY